MKPILSAKSSPGNGPVIDLANKYGYAPVYSHPSKKRGSEVRRGFGRNFFSITPRTF